MGQSKTQTVQYQADPALRQRGLSLWDTASGYGGGGNYGPSAKVRAAASRYPANSFYGKLYGGIADKIEEKYGTGGGGFGGMGQLPQGLSDPEQQALGAYGSMLDGSFFSGNIGQYMNPYIQDVIGQNTADLDRARQLANIDAAGYATRAGAFGGDRAALLEAENNRNFLDSVARSSAQLRSAGFDMASRNLFQGAGMGLAGLSGLGYQQRMIPFQNYSLLSQMLAQAPGNQQQVAQLPSGSIGGSVIGGASVGGSVGGPWGAVIGGGLGALGGLSGW